jgi:ABC-type Mn2+/Zn2+ transport system ATPase subunit
MKANSGFKMKKETKRMLAQVSDVHERGELRRAMITAQIQKWHDRGKTILCVMHDVIAVRQIFKECIVIAQDAVKQVPMDLITDEFLAQIFFCGRHAGAHDVV